MPPVYAAGGYTIICFHFVLLSRAVNCRGLRITQYAHAPHTLIFKTSPLSTCSGSRTLYAALGACTQLRGRAGGGLGLGFGAKSSPFREGFKQFKSVPACSYEGGGQGRAATNNLRGDSLLLYAPGEACRSSIRKQNRVAKLAASADSIRAFPAAYLRLAHSAMASGCRRSPSASRSVVDTAV